MFLRPKDVWRRRAAAEARIKEETVDVIEQDVLLRPKEVAAIFRVTTRTLQRWGNAGLISCTRTPGGHRRYRRSEVEGALQDAKASN